MVSVRWDSGLLRSLGQAVATALVASTIIFLPTNVEPASATTDTVSEVDYYVDLNGTNQAVYGLENTPALNLGSSDWTVEAWIKPAALVGSQTGVERMILNKELSYEFGIFEGTYQFALMPEDTNFTWQYRDTGIAPLPDQWQHVAFAKSGNSLRFYLNGFEVYSTNSATSVPSSIRSSNLILSLGGRESTTTGNVPTGAWLDGGIDEVRIWTELRSSSEINSAMHLKLDGTQANLLAYWDFNESSGTSVLDRSANNLDLALHNSPPRVDVKQVTSVAGGDTVVTFPRTYLPGVGGWQSPVGVSQVQYLVVGGGGAGSRYEGGGGGAGGFKPGTQATNPGSTYAVKVGAGGLAINSGNVSVDRTLANPGQSSTFSTITALGGGGGGAQLTNGGDGGTGAYGGGGGGNGGQSAGSGGVSIDAPWTGGDGSENTGGGGAGAGGAGTNGTDGLSGDGGAGGSGSSSSITGQSVYYSGGGGGGSSNGNAGAGGSGGGGSGGGLSSQAALSGEANSGGGGGGSALGLAASGGSGVIILRYTPSKDFAWSKSDAAADSAFRTENVIPASGNFTIEGWFLFTEEDLDSDYNGLFSQMTEGDSNAKRVSLWARNNQLLYSTGGTTGTTAITSWVASPNRWHHIAMARNGNDVEIHVDGVLVAKANSSWDIGSYFTLGGVRQRAGDITSFGGNLDQVKVWSAALTASELVTSMHTYSSSGISGPTLRAHYDFNDFQQDLILDRSGSGRHLSTPESYSPAAAVEDSIVQTGNASSKDVYIKFNRSYLTALGGWTVPSGMSRVEALVVGGGGAGGFALEYSAGGGGGGEVTTSSAVVTPGTVLPVKVGQGGVSRTDGANVTSLTPTPGQQSQLGLSTPLFARAGGEGASGDGTGTPFSTSPTAGLFTGGGGGAQAGESKISNPAIGLGFNGGDGRNDGSNADQQSGGGGGGASADGSNGSDTSGGVGGAGVFVSSVQQTFGGGGGGGKRTTGNSGTGGAGGAGGGGDGGVGASGSSAPANSGGGGGGAGGNPLVLGGHGGSGAIFLAYSLAPDAPTSLTATQSTSHATINLSWTAPGYTGNSAITDYDIEFKPAGGSWTSYSDGVSTTTVRAVELPTQCVSYDFRVIAKNSSFQSVASATASATPVWGTFESLTGVQISSTNSECVVKFTSTASNSWTPPSATEKVRALIVGGGGGGGYHVGSGGGAGGFLDTEVNVTAGTGYAVQVGDGGAGGSLTTANCQNIDAADSDSCGNPSRASVQEDGEDSVFGSITVAGGGRGGSWNYVAPNSGGSGGGASVTGNYEPTGNTIVSGPGLATSLNGVALGNSGGGYGTGREGLIFKAGGGGGAGGPGVDGGHGGPGRVSTISGEPQHFAGGGGAGGHNSDAETGSGGVGGGGDGANRQNSTPDPSQHGDNGTGGGGGGGGWSNCCVSSGGNGGSGIVILRQLSVTAPVISSQPQSSSVEPGQSVAFAVLATGNGTLSYQWQSSTDGTNWSNVGTDSSSFTTPTLSLSDNGTRYRVVVTNALNGETSVVTSSEAVISVVGVTIGSGLCETLVSNDSGATVSQTAAGGCLLEFTTPGNNIWFVPANVSSVEALVVGGGGGGASGRGDGYNWYGGGAGGGGGEYTKVTLDVTTSQQIPLVVGAGGSAGGASARGALPNPGGQGGNSSFSVSGAVALGGSGGQGSTVLGVGGSGGSGGSGTGVAGSSGGDGSDGLAWRSYERPTDGGAAKLTTLGGEQYCLGGGGGGGNRGANATHFYYQAQGGDCSSAGLGSGGDGNYFNGSNYVLAGEGVANTGGGGGGGSYNSGGGFAGAAGASGLVALYYVPGAGAVSLSQPNAMSYSSTANTTSITLTKTSPGNASWTTSNQAICTVSGDNTGATVTVLIAGVCAVSVTVASAGGFSTGSAEVSFRIDKITQPAPSWDAAAATVAFGGTVDLYEKLDSPSGASNYSFTVSGTGCSVTGVILNVGNAGSNCVVTPIVNETNKFLAISGTNLTVSVTKISQSALVLTSATSMNVDQTLTLSAAGGSGTGALSYHVSNQGTTGCLVNSSTGALSATAAGSCEVYAKRALSTNYDEVTSSNVVITINKISQNLSWVSQPQAQYVSGNTYALEATASSQLTIAYSISAGLCTLSGTTVTFTGSGDCVILAGQSGDASYLEAVTISQTVSVGKINQTMTFSALADKSWGSLAFSLSATASSALAITYTKNNQTTNDACDVSTNGIVTIKNVGTCAIMATQAGNSSYTSVTTTRLFDVTANQAGAPFIGSVSFGDRQLNASFFTPSYLGGGTVSAYELQAHPLDGGAVVKNTGCIPQQGPNQSCSVIGLTNGVTYELKVAAITQAGLGQLSASSSQITPAANPEAVANLVAIEGNGTLTLQWTPPTSLGGGTFDQYRIYWRAPGDNYQPNGAPGAFIATQASTSYVITGLQNGVAYDVKVITTTGVNTAELQSNTAEVRQTPFTVPDAPAAVVALDNDNNVVVAWQPPVFDGGNPIDQYVVEKDGTAVCTITSATTTSCEVTKPSPGITSVIEVRAGNDAGLSDAVSTSITIQAVQGSSTPVGGGGGVSLPGVTPGALAPIVLDVSGSAIVKTNEVVRLIGTNFNLVEKVLIGDVEASFFVNSAQLITIRIPIDVAAGKPTITLLGAFGSRIFANLIEISVTQVSIDTKVTIGTFLGYAAVYTKNHEGKRLSMKIGNKWRVIDSLGANYTYNLTKVGVGRTVTVEVYVDRVLVQVKQIKIQ